MHYCSIEHYDGKSCPDGSEKWFQSWSGEVDWDLRGIWGSGPSDVFAIGQHLQDGVVLHYDGASWKEVYTSPGNVLSSVWSSGPSDVFVVGRSGLILHYDGTSWQKMLSPSAADLRGVAGNSSSEVFAAGANGTLLFFDGKTWSLSRADLRLPGSSSCPELTSVAAAGAGAAFAVGEQEIALQYCPKDICPSR